MRRQRSIRDGPRLNRISQATLDVVGGRENKRHPIVDLGHQLVSFGRDDGEGAYPLARSRVLPVLP
jgi:hypothetical protein